MKKGELKKDSKDYLNYKTILTTMLCTLVGVLFILCLIFVGMEMASKDRRSIFTSNDVEVIPVYYEQQQVGYEIEDWQISQDTDTPYIFSDFNTKYYGKDYAVINSKTQLDQLMQTAASVAGETDFHDMDSSFFETGSVIAVALEKKDYYSYNISSVTRDENYNLQINVDAFKYEQTDEEVSKCNVSDSDETTDEASSETANESTDCIEIAPKIESTLFLLNVQNIQPHKVNVVINEITD